LRICAALGWMPALKADLSLLLKLFLQLTSQNFLSSLPLIGLPQ